VLINPSAYIKNFPGAIILKTTASHVHSCPVVHF